MKPIVYVETSVISYLTAWPSPDIVVAAQQQLTREWWNKERQHCTTIISQVVLREAAQGDPVAAKLRLEKLAGIQSVPVTDSVVEFAESLIANGAVPPIAADDALHLAAAVVSGADFLLTWNFRHIANASVHAKIQAACRNASFTMPMICTPQVLLWSVEDGP